MRTLPRRLLALSLCDLLIISSLSGCAARQAAEISPAPAYQDSPLRAQVQKSYLELFDAAAALGFSAAEIQAQREGFQTGEKRCVAHFKDHAKQYGKQLEAAQKTLRQTTARISEAERKDLHCRIQNLDQLQREAELLARHGIPTAYDNLNAKLDLIEKWPSLLRQIQEEIASEHYMQRRWSDVEDIGFREIAAHQEDDIKTGQKAIEELRRNGLVPPDLDNQKIQDYVNSVAQRIARHSDLKVPLHVTVLQSREINAFALPGGYLFVQRGLLEATDNETQLAGVLAHEIAHITARHGHKLTRRAIIASIFYQAAQVAALILTGGAVGPGLYYALEYGFAGLGLILDLRLLGVSRDYEQEADQLGVQYAWSTGYDPAGFVQFFDKMATREGYANGLSWFRTHPPFFERMVATQREIMFLPSKPPIAMEPAAFEQMKQELAPITAQAEKEETTRPRLTISVEQGCAAPRKIEYTPGQLIEPLCNSPMVVVPGLAPG